jgi:hypothetical protein
MVECLTLPGNEEHACVIALVWQFDVKAGQNDAFEALYGADGAWTALSRRSRSFLGSSFLRDLAISNRYLLVEYWSEMVVYEKPRRSDLVAAERTVGVDAPQRVPSSRCVTPR